jgi:DNA polymerase III epsilon subunit-like protein
MLLSTDLCRLPSKNSFKSYKWPRLQELHFHLFGNNFDGAHNSETDSYICAKCFFELIRKKEISL